MSPPRIRFKDRPTATRSLSFQGWFRCPEGFEAAIKTLRSAIASLVAAALIVAAVGSHQLCRADVRQSDHATSAGTNEPGSPSLAADVLAPIRHRTRGIRDEESDSYYRALKQARDTDYGAQQAAALHYLDRRQQESPRNRGTNYPFPAFVDLFQHPEVYHGRPVTLRGHVRLLRQLSADENASGITTLYEAWLYTDDSQSNPAVIVCTSIPDGMPLGSDLVEQVEVTGFFFKIYGYSAKDTTRIAPLILAQRLDWFPKAAPAPKHGAPLSLYAAIAAVFPLLAWWMWRTWQKGHRMRASHQKSSGGIEPRFDALDNLTESSASAADTRTDGSDRLS